jgi:predicted RNA-binding protein with PUA-like domain
MRHWLIKSEADVYSIDDLNRDGRTAWDGVRNYQARNWMRDDMKPGDLVLFYHSNGDPPGVAGLAKVASAPYDDPTQFDPASPYHDPKSTPQAPRWQLVDFAFVERFPAEVPLPLLKADPSLDGMELLRKGSRLSVQPVTEAHFQRVLALARG